MTRGRCATVLLLSLFVVPFIPTPAHAALGGCITIKTASGAMSTDCSGGATPDKPSTQTGADKNSQNADISCPDPDTYHKYDATKGKTWIEIRNDLKVTITNLYGKPCSDIRNDVEVVEGKCVAAHKCQATECYGTDCKLPDTKVQPQTGSGTADPAKQGTTAGLDDLNQTKEINANPMGNLGDTPQSVLGKVFSGSDFQSPSLYDAYGVQPLFDSSLESPSIVPESVYEGLPQSGITNDFGNPTQISAEMHSLEQSIDQPAPPQTFAPSAQQTGFEAPQEFPQLPSGPQGSAQPSFPTAGAPLNGSFGESFPPPPAPISDPWTVEPAPTPTTSGLAPIDAAYEPQTKFTTDQTFYPTTSDWTKLGTAQYPFLSSDKIASGQVGGAIDQGGIVAPEPGQIRTAQDIAITSPAEAYRSGQSIESTVPAVGLNGGWATNGIAGTSLWHGNVSAINGNGTNIGYEWDPTGTYVNFGTPPSGVLAEQQAERDANLAALQPQETAVPDRSVLSIDPGQAPATTQTFSPEKTTWDTVKEYAGNAWDGAKYAANEFFGIGSANAKPSAETIAQGGAGETIEGQASVYNPYRPGEKSGGPGLATGGRYDPQSYDAAIQTDIGRAASCGTGVTGSCYALVEQGDKALVVKVNDNGPLVGNRIIDLNQKSMDYFTGEKNSVSLLDDVRVTMLPKDGAYTAGPVDSATAQELRTGSSDPSEPLLTRTGGSEVNAPVVGGDTRQDLAFGENPPVTTQPSQSKFAYEWQPDVSYGALGGAPQAVSAKDLPDITPIENRFPTASWIPDAQLSGEELTAQIRASAEYDATKGITEYPTNDALSQDNQIYADERAALQDRLAQADRESNAYVDKQLSQIPLGPSVSGEEITAQINREIDAQIPPVNPADADVRLPTQAEAQAQLLASEGKTLDMSSIYEPENRVGSGDGGVNAAIDKALAEAGVKDERVTFDQTTDQKIRGLFDQKIKDAQAQVSFAQDLLARSETPIAKDAAQAILDDSNARLNKIVDNAISYSAGYPNDALKAAGERLAQNEGRGVLNNIFQANADQGKALAHSLADGINLSDMSATDVAKGVGWAGAELWATTNGAIANLGSKIGLPGFAADPASEVADAIDPYGSEYKTLADAAAIAPFAYGPAKNLVGAGLDSATGAVFGTVTRDAAAAGFGVENAGIGATVRDSAGFALERPTLQFSKLSDGSFGLAEEAVAAEAGAASRSGVLALQESGGASVSTGQRGASALDGAAANTGVGKDLTSGLQRNTVTELPEAGVAQEGRALSTGTGGRVVEPDYIPGDGTNPPRIIISAKPNTPVAAEVVAEGEGVAAGESLGGAVTEGAPRAITRAANDNIPVPEVAIAPEQVRVQAPAPTFYERAVDTWTNFKNDVSEFFSPTPAPRIEPTVNANPSTVRISEPIEYPSYVPSQTSGTVPGKLAEPQVAPVVSGPSGEISTGSQINHAITPEPTIPSSVAKPSVVADEQEIRSLLSRLAQQNETPLQRMAGDLGDVRPGAQGSPAGSAAGDLSTVQVNQPISPTNQAPSLDGAVGSAKNSLDTFTSQESAAVKQLESLAGKTSEDGIERTQGLGSLREAVYRDPVEPVITTDKPVHIELPPTAEVNAKISLGELPADGVRVELTDANSRVAISATAEQRAALARNADSSGRTIEVVVSREDLARLESGAGDVTLYPAPKTPYAAAADTGKSAALETVATPGWFSGVRDRVSKVWDNIFGGKPAEIGDLSAETGTVVPREVSLSVRSADTDTISDVVAQQYALAPKSPVNAQYSIALKDLPENATSLSFGDAPGQVTLYRGLGQKYDVSYGGAEPYFTRDLQEAVGYATKNGTDPHVVAIKMDTQTYADLVAYRQMQGISGDRALGLGEATNGYVQLPKDWLEATTRNPSLMTDISGASKALQEASVNSNATIDAALAERTAAYQRLYQQHRDSDPAWPSMTTAERDAVIYKDPAYIAAQQKTEAAYAAQDTAKQIVAEKFLGGEMAASQQSLLSRTWQGIKDMWSNGLGNAGRVESRSLSPSSVEAEAKQLDLPLGETRKTDLVSQVARSSAEEKPTVDPTYLNWRSSSQKAVLGGTATLSAPLFFAYMNPNSVLNPGDTKAVQGESGAQSFDEAGFIGAKQGQTTSATYYGPEFTDAFGTIPGQEVLKADYYCIRSVFPLAVTQLKAGSVFPTSNCVNLPPSKASAAPVAAPTAAPTQSAPQIANQQSGFGGIINAIGSAVGGFLGNLLKGQGNAQNQNTSPTNPATPTTPTTPSAPGTPASDGKPQVSLVANPSAISAGQQSTLSWSSVGASQCAVVDGAGAAVGSSSPLTVSPQTTTTYKITCGDAVSSQTTVTVK